ncbi:MAG: glycosyltransferase family 4 protein [Cyclobacteriaceae bacterium]
MKIAQVCPYDFSRPGGVKSHIESLSKYLQRAGHDVKILAPKPSVQQTNVYHFGGNKSINLGGTKIDINIALGSDRKSLKNFLKEEKFDIIHFHTFWNPLLPFQIRRFSNSKYITTFHDTPKNQFVGKNIMPIAAKGVFKLMDAIISVSETQASYINRFSRREISIIPNGIDLELYSKPISPINRFKDDKLNILFLSRLEPRKGLIYALESYKTLKSANSNLRLLIAGDGDERQLAEKMISEHNLSDVEMLGFVSETEKLQLLKTADIYLAPAIYGESFGIVLLEAMAMGTPLVGFANEGYLNVISGMQKEYFAEPRDSVSLTAMLKKLCEDPNIRSTLSQKGLEKVKNYDWPLVTSEILKMYEKLA